MGKGTFVFIIGGLVGGLWSCAAALGVLAAAGRLAADLSAFSVHLSLHRSQGITLKFSDQRFWSGQKRVEELAGSPDLVSAGPAEGQAVVWFLAFFLRLNDSVLLKLNETVLGVPRPEAAKQQAHEFSGLGLVPGAVF